MQYFFSSKETSKISKVLREGYLKVLKNWKIWKNEKKKSWVFLFKDFLNFSEFQLSCKVTLVYFLKTHYQMSGVLQIDFEFHILCHPISRDWNDFITYFKIFQFGCVHQNEYFTICASLIIGIYCNPRFDWNNNSAVNMCRSSIDISIAIFVRKSSQLHERGL